MQRTLKTSVFALLLALGLTPLVAGGVAATDDGGGTAANTVTIAIAGGDATALAGCLNAVKKGDKVYQQNKCKNKAFAQGGDVRLINVDITIVQENF